MTPALCVVVKTPGPAAPAKGSGRQKARVFGSAAPAGNTADESLRLSAAGIRRTITDAAEDGRTPQSPAKAGLPDNTT